MLSFLLDYSWQSMFLSLYIHLGIWILKTNMENKYRVLLSCLKNDIEFALGKFTISLI